MTGRCSRLQQLIPAHMCWQDSTILQALQDFDLHADSDLIVWTMYVAIALSLYFAGVQCSGYLNEQPRPKATLQYVHAEQQEPAFIKYFVPLLCFACGSVSHKWHRFEMQRKSRSNLYLLSQGSTDTPKVDNWGSWVMTHIIETLCTACWRAGA